MTVIPGRTVFEKCCVAFSCVAYGLMVLLLGLLANSQFEDRRSLETGMMVEGTILTVSPGRGRSSGTVAYRLPSGVSCRDYTELGPINEVRPDEPLTVAVDGTCGHPVSTKKRLNPWLYLSMCLSIALYLPFVIWRSRRKKVSLSAAA